MSAVETCSSRAFESHLLRLRAGREKGPIRTGGVASVYTHAESARREALSQVERHAKQVQARRQEQLTRVYGNKDKITVATAAPSPSGKSRMMTDAGLEILHTLLGEGTTARVYRGLFGPRRSEVAVKVALKEKMTEEEVGWIREEMCASIVAGMQR